MRCLFEGTGVAIVTPFKNGKIDFDAFANLIEKDLYEGAKAIIVLGTTGEGATIDDREREKIVKCAKRVIDGRAKLIVGTGHNNSSKAYQNTLEAKRLGADGVLVVTPYYNKTTQAGLEKYYMSLAEIGIPVIMYNVPSRTGLNISVETLKKLTNCEMIYGIKESTNDISRIISLAKVCKKKIALYSGEDSLNFVFYCLGGQGCISVTANVLCQQVQKVYDLVRMGDIKEAGALQDVLAPFNEGLFCETNPIPIKYLLSKLGYIENELRMPLVSLSKEGQKVVNKLVEKQKDC